MSIPLKTFYHSSVRNITAAFGSLFTNVVVQRIKEDNTVDNVIRVPLAYASGDKTIKLLQQQDIQRRENRLDVKISLPRMSFDLTSMNYDSARKTPSVNYLMYGSTGVGNKSMERLFNPVPYNIEYSLNIFTKYVDDSLQIIEQILPYFTPQYTLTLNDIPSLGITRDVPIYITSISKDDTYEGAVEEDRILQWTLTFIANAWIYPPVSDSNIIKKAYTNLFDFDSEEKLYGVLYEVIPATADRDDSYTIQKTEFTPGATGF